MAGWNRRGLIVTPRADDSWWSHAQNPTVLPLREDRWRIYFGARDARNRSSLFAVDVDPQNEMRVLDEHFRPLLEPGRTGAFDASGLGPCCALVAGARVHLYYAAFVPRSDVPFDTSIGLAASDDGLAFERVTTGPVLSTGPYDPYYVSTPFVRPIASGFEMWYQSVTGWSGADGTREATYTIRRTESADGILWSPASTAALDATDPDVIGYTRPWIVDGSDGSRMWFSRRGADLGNGRAGAYRIVSAPLAPGGTQAGTPIQEIRYSNPPLPGDWDDRMQAYASIARLGDRLVMFYNGNDFGRHGFGWAIEQ